MSDHQEPSKQENSPLPDPVASAPIFTASVEPSPWGLWATAGFSLVIIAGFIGAQLAVGVGMVLLVTVKGRTESALELASSGFFWSLATCASTPVAIGLSWLFASLRRGISAGDYLGLRKVAARVFVRWCLVLLVLLVMFDLTTTWLNRPIVPDVMINAYRSAHVIPLLWLALVVGAPLGEEIFFRGFLFKGILHSRMGPAGAIFLTSAAWSAVHLQYDLYGIGIIFVTGLLFGLARLRSGSIYPGIVMHGLMNLIATIQVATLVRYAGEATPN